MDFDIARLPLLITPAAAREKFHHLLEMSANQNERFLVTGGREDSKIMILSAEDFLAIAGLDKSWIEKAWDQAQQHQGWHYQT